MASISIYLSKLIYICVFLPQIAPGRPRNLTATLVSKWDAQLKWMKPSYGYSIVQNYQIIVNNTYGSKSIKTDKSETFLLQSLLPYNNYTIFIYAIANTTMSQASNIVVISTPPKSKHLVDKCLSSHHYSNLITFHVGYIVITVYFFAIFHIRTKSTANSCQGYSYKAKCN